MGEGLKSGERERKREHERELTPYFLKWRINRKMPNVIQKKDEIATQAYYLETGIYTLC